MARTIRDVLVSGRSVPDVLNAIMAWASAHSLKIEDNRGTYIRVRLPKSGTEWAASFVWETAKIIEIRILEDPRGVVVHTEGYVKPPMTGEEEFSPTAVMTGIPKRAGWHAIEDLWMRLGALSAGGVPQAPPSYPPPQPAPVASMGWAPPPPAVGSVPVSPSPTGPTSAPPPYPPSGRPTPAPPPVSQMPAALAPASFCSFCGAAVGTAEKFCRKCGSRVL